ncbi:MAG: uroporphyrinogen decarboxylase family protein [Chloroflexi bacterium]|nr:uroporphyrinogen decarboxylase family protein [Chloroflexota bacterium]
MPRTEEMTSLERILAAADLKEVDRVPALPQHNLCGMKWAGHSYAECYHDVDKYVHAQLRAWREVGGDGVFDFHMYNIEESLGAQVVLHDSLAVRDPVIRTRDDLNRLLPYDGKSSGRSPAVQNIIRKLKQSTNARVAVIGFVHSPFEVAISLRGFRNFYLDLVRDPAFAKQLSDFLVPMAASYAEALVEAGADIIRTVNPSANASCISRKHYQEFAFPPMQKFFARLKARGIKILFHICGDWRDRLDLVCALGADILHVDRIDLARFKQEYGRKVCVMGNVRTVETMLYGTPADVERKALDCIKQAAEGGGFILSANCQLPPDTPQENVKAMVDAARFFWHD